MSDYLSSRLESDPVITIHYHCAMTAVHGDEHLAGITVHNKSLQQDAEYATSAVGEGSVVISKVWEFVNA